jgi:hypothetical protein
MAASREIFRINFKNLLRRRYQQRVSVQYRQKGKCTAVTQNENNYGCNLERFFTFHIMHVKVSDFSWNVQHPKN